MATPNELETGNAGTRGFVPGKDLLLSEEKRPSCGIMIIAADSFMGALCQLEHIIGIHRQEKIKPFCKHALTLVLRFQFEEIGAKTGKKRNKRTTKFRVSPLIHLRFHGVSCEKFGV